jgi:NAD(P)-dependent dehydrogenase (short-subunit alcohol dehydrogenase family)
MDRNPRLRDKVAIVIGAGQSPGEGIGNGRATVLRFAQEGAKVMAVDRDLASARETAQLVEREGGECIAFEADSGAILMISSLAALEKYPFVTYKATKAAMIAFTQQVAIQNAEYGIRANAILPGLMDTPMAVDTRARASGRPRAQVAAERDRRVPLRHKMGTAWDVANAALFLASDEAGFITGVALLVDGGGALNVG